MEGFLDMQQRQKGFSLMEALISLLVFSIGMLGLGQLQARLWANSGNIHSANQALLIAENITEIIELKVLITQGDELAPTLPAYLPPPEFTYEQSALASGLVTTTAVQVLWQRPSGADSTSLQTSFISGFLARDAAWLSPKD